jgi:hypothetical protein
MGSVFAVLLSSLAVLCALFVLISEDRSTPNSSELIQREKTSDAGERLVQAIMLRRQRLLADADSEQGTASFEKRWYLLRTD